MKKTIITVTTALIMLMLLTACAPGPNGSRDVPDSSGEVVGFWTGLWHGIIVPVTFVISLFTDGVTPYDVHNNGGWYNAGFLLGISMVFGGSGRGTACRRRG